MVLVDEVAELFLIADKSEKDQVTRTGTALLRVAQLGRAFGVYLIVCGQRIGSDLGPGVTALRSQLSPRHVPDEIHQVPGIPRTLSGKKLEVPVRKILLGTDPERAADPNALANQEVLAYFAPRLP